MIKNTFGVVARTHPAKVLLLCYVFYALLGWFVLNLPLCQTRQISLLDNFFTAISAMSTTGLVTVHVGSDYTIFGQVVILLLIQVGGIGYMTFNTFIILATTNRLSRFSKKIITAEFPLPKDFVIHEFILHVLIFTFICEFVGALALGCVFKSHGVENYIWNSIFHSISSFCTAGFSLFPNNLMDFKYNVALNAIISTLCILGAIGFITWLNFYKKLIGKKKYLSFTAKIILFVTFWFITLGTIIFMLTENLFTTGSFGHQLTIGFFQIMTATTTAGFNTMDIASLKQTSIILLLFLMAIGASPSGTGGGLKTTTFVALVGLVKSTLKGETVPSFWKREIPAKRLQLATATFAYYIFLLSISVFILISLENEPFIPVIFEAASALANIGLTMGLTTTLSEAGKGLVALLMMMGKIGILTFGIALTTQAHNKIEYKKDNELVF